MESTALLLLFFERKRSVRNYRTEKVTQRPAGIRTREPFAYRANALSLFPFRNFSRFSFFQIFNLSSDKKKPFPFGYLGVRWTTVVGPRERQDNSQTVHGVCKAGGEMLATVKVSID